MGEIINIYINVVDRITNPPKGLLSDTGVLASVNMNTRQFLVTVLPSEEGIRPLAEKTAYIKERTSVVPDYYLRTDFEALENIIDAVKGIDVTTEKNYKIGESLYPRGVNHMTGRHAMALFKKTCKTEEEMLSLRESVVEGLIRKGFEGFSFSYNLPKLYSVLKNDIETNINAAVIKDLYSRRTSLKDRWHIEKQYMMKNDTEEELNSKYSRVKTFNNIF